MFQKCPICNGTGKVGSCMNCDVCNGKKIISELNGKPPIDDVEINNCQSYRTMIYDTPDSCGGNGNPFELTKELDQIKNKLNEAKKEYFKVNAEVLKNIESLCGIDPVNGVQQIKQKSFQEILDANTIFNKKTTTK